MATLGFVRGHHYTEYVENIKQLKRQKEHDKAISLLLRIVDAAEHESIKEQWGVPPWSYEQLAIIYRKQNEHDNKEKILKRYVDFETNRGFPPVDYLVKRLLKVEELKYPGKETGSGTLVATDGFEIKSA